jgi:diamine N-acetyltransferase
VIDLRPVLREHLAALFALAVAPGQEGLVAPPAESLAEAAWEPGAWLRGLWADDRPVGLLLMIDPRGPVAEPFADPDAAYLWRLMVDAGAQGRGFGRAALEAAKAQAVAWGSGALTVHAVDRPGGAIPFYRRHGFVATGRFEDTGQPELIWRAPQKAPS